MKKILLIGDSIRQLYQPHVIQKLDGIAEVWGPEENCRFAKYTLWHINEWINTMSSPDIIHWNNGIWDIFHINETAGIFTPLDEYITGLKRILQEMRKTNAQIIWATMTPVDPRFVYCRNDEIDQYNQAALEFMQSENIAINDLNTIIREDIDAYIGEDLLHLC